MTDSAPFDPDRQRGPIAWMAKNSVASNLLMLFLIAGGALAGFSVKQEVFPEFDLDIVRIGVPYPGASPSEVESGIVLAVLTMFITTMATLVSNASLSGEVGALQVRMSSIQLRRIRLAPISGMIAMGFPLLGTKMNHGRVGLCQNSV